MSNYLKPQTPIQLNDNYIYPLTTADQVILNDGNRLNSLFKKTIKENVTLNASNWSDTKPYTQTITLTYSVDDYDVDANVAYGDEDNAALHAAAGCISYIKKNHKEITFYCLKSKPKINIPIEITGTCRNTIATVEDSVKLNFKVVGGTTEPTNPTENMIWVSTDTPITGYIFSATQPEAPTDDSTPVWIATSTSSLVNFSATENNPIMVYPISIKQYVNGNWTDVTAKTWQNGEWEDWWNGELYINGNQYEGATGGWVNKKIFTWQGKYNYASNTEDIIFDGAMKLTAANSRAMYATTEKLIDLTNFTELHCEVLTDSPTDGIFVHKATEGKLNSDAYDAKMDLSKGANVLPISELNGEYYISVGVADDNTIEVDNIKLVKGGSAQ
jgi:hypothetical protein